MQLPRNGKSAQLLLATAAFLLASAVAGAANAACTITYGSLTSTLPNLGNVVSATTNETVFRVAPKTGSISVASGNGARTSSGTSIVSMSISTANHAHCDNLVISGTVTATGATNRAKTLRNFDIDTGGSLSVSNESGTGGTRTFTLSMNKNQSGTLYIGADFPIKGDNEGGATGSSNLAASSYSVVLDATNGNDVTRTGTGRATVRRSLQVTKNSDLKFGRIVRPSTGSSTVTISPITGLRTVTGTGVGLSDPAPSWAHYTVSGEGGQTLSINVAGSVSMTGPGTPLSVTLTSFRPSPQQLSGSANSTGTYEFWVGGNFSLSSTAASGTYSGIFNVTIAYN